MENENDKRASRAAESRSKSERPKVWQRSNNLDTPPAKDGYRYKWIRAEVQGYQDTRNVTGKLREGYELVRADEFPNYPVVEDGKYKGIIGVGGLCWEGYPKSSQSKEMHTIDKCTTIRARQSITISRRNSIVVCRSI